MRRTLTRVPTQSGRDTICTAKKGSRALGSAVPRGKPKAGNPHVAPAPGARAYLFDDGAGRVVAAVWKFSRQLDYGQAEGETMTFAWKGKDLEVFDMMGNRREVKVEKVGGGVKLPLSNFPFYLRVPEAKGDALLEAINTCETTGRQDVSLGFDVKPLSRSKVRVTIVNPLSRPFEGKVSFFPNSPCRSIGLAPRGACAVEQDLPEKLDFARENELVLPIVVSRGAASVRKTYRYRILPVRRTEGCPDWSKMPAVPHEFTTLLFCE